MRYCFHLQIRPERMAEYVARHQAVWPDMQDALRATGWRNYSLFLRSDGRPPDEGLRLLTEVFHLPEEK
jgi:L-rhamnose mutarotase